MCGCITKGRCATGCLPVCVCKVKCSCKCMCSEYGGWGYLRLGEAKTGLWFVVRVGRGV